MRPALLLLALAACGDGLDIDALTDAANEPTDCVIGRWPRGQLPQAMTCGVACRDEPPIQYYPGMLCEVEGAESNKMLYFEGVWGSCLDVGDEYNPAVRWAPCVCRKTGKVEFCAT